MKSFHFTEFQVRGAAFHALYFLGKIESLLKFPTSTHLTLFRLKKKPNTQKSEGSTTHWPPEALIYFETISSARIGDLWTPECWHFVSYLVLTRRKLFSWLRLATELAAKDNPVSSGTVWRAHTTHTLLALGWHADLTFGCLNLLFAERRYGRVNSWGVVLQEDYEGGALLGVNIVWGGKCFRTKRKYRFLYFVIWLNWTVSLRNDFKDSINL